MSTATLNVWITQRGDPCRILNPTKPLPNERFVYVLHCNGDILEWCGTKYVGLQTKCGHLEIEIPPGCYIVGAVESTGGYLPLGNCLTHIAVIRANCGDHVCVTLFDPSLHVCGTWLGAAINQHVAGGGGGGHLNPDLIGLMQNAQKAVNKMLDALPPDPLSKATAAIAAARPAKG